MHDSNRSENKLPWQDGFLRAEGFAGKRIYINSSIVDFNSDLHNLTSLHLLTQLLWSCSSCPICIILGADNQQKLVCGELAIQGNPFSYICSHDTPRNDTPYYSLEKICTARIETSHMNNDLNCIRIPFSRETRRCR